MNTRLLLRRLWDSFSIPIFALVDADPHGEFMVPLNKKGYLENIFLISP